VARRLHLVRAWEERAEDPFRGLRAGPASFSPLTSADGNPGRLRSLPTLQNTRTTERGRAVAPTKKIRKRMVIEVTSEQWAKGSERPTGCGLVRDDAKSNRQE
jgi:hypothetical protein